MASAASSSEALIASATIASNRARDIVGHELGFTSGRTTDERATPLVSQWPRCSKETHAMMRIWVDRRG